MFPYWNPYGGPNAPPLNAKESEPWAPANGRPLDSGPRLSRADIKGPSEILNTLLSEKGSGGWGGDSLKNFGRANSDEAKKVRDE